MLSCVSVHSDLHETHTNGEWFTAFETNRELLGGA